GAGDRVARLREGLVEPSARGQRTRAAVMRPRIVRISRQRGVVGAFGFVEQAGRPERVAVQRKRAGACPGRLAEERPFHARADEVPFAQQRQRQTGARALAHPVDRRAIQDGAVRVGGVRETAVAGEAVRTLEQDVSRRRGLRGEYHWHERADQRRERAAAGPHESMPTSDRTWRWWE